MFSDYPMSDQAIEYDEKFVSFMDILGFRSFVNQPKADSVKIIQALNQDIEHALCAVTEDKYLDDSLSVKLFSDCFCISSNDLFVILKEISFIQSFLALNGIFISGALSRGLHYENHNIIFSKGLVDAYELSKKAKYPRVIVSNELLTEYGQTIEKGCILKSPDNICFVHYLNQFPYYEDIPDEDVLLESHKESIVYQVNNNINIPNVLEKYKWAAEYHNHYVHASYNQPDWEEDYYLEILQRLLVPMTIFPGFAD
jgi:hypothetical protein